MAPKSSLELISQPQDYFRQLVTEALSKQKVTVYPETEFYLVNLLNQFVTTEKLKQEPLALLVKEALETSGTEEQKQRFKTVGDVSLYMAGFFQASLNRKLVDVDYYIEMGGTAYSQVAARAEEDALRATFKELANRFATFVDLFAEISDKTSVRTEKDLLRLYDLWLRTRSERAAKALQEAGILPNETIKKDWQ